MAIIIIGMRRAPTVSKSQMATMPSFCPIILIIITYSKSISFHTYVEHIEATFFTNMRLPIKHYILKSKN